VDTGILADIFGPDIIIVALLALVLLFGGSQLPKLARSIGSAQAEFKKGLQEGSKGEGADKATDADADKPPTS
jgi:sec-independent protein translocase protein TatA